MALYFPYVKTSHRITYGAVAIFCAENLSKTVLVKKINILFIVKIVFIRSKEQQQQKTAEKPKM